MPMKMMMWEDEETSCGATGGGGGGRGGESPGLCIVTRSNILLTQSLDGDETESAGISLMTEYPCTVNSSSEAPCS